jgi:hypothetical protein
VEVFRQCISSELGRPFNPDDTEGDALDKEAFHCSARLVLALELAMQVPVTAEVINFADPFNGRSIL